jgi:hypothetical protein
MSISLTLNDLSKLALVASDTSYFTKSFPVAHESALAPLDERDPTIDPRFAIQAGFFEGNKRGRESFHVEIISSSVGDRVGRAVMS